MKLRSAGDQRDKRKADLEGGRSRKKKQKNIATKAKRGGVEVVLVPLPNSPEVLVKATSVASTVALPGG